MAKLNVTIPAVDVMVNGQAYRKVDRKAQAGDIVKARVDRMDVTEGAYYGPVRPDHDGDLGFDDNVGDFRWSLLQDRSEMFEVYAPVSAETLAAPSDVIAHNGATYRKVDQPACEGDVVVFPEAPYSYLTAGKAYMVNDIDGHGDAQIADDDGDNYDTAGDTFDVYEKVMEPSESPASEYREVVRKANAGERIKIVERWSSRDPYENGDVLTVSSREDGEIVLVTVGSAAVRVNDREYVVLEPAAPAQPPKYSAGDYVRVTGNSVRHNYAVGSVVRITHEEPGSLTSGGQRFHAESADGSRGNWLVTNDVEPTTEAEFLAQKKPALKVGDYAKISTKEDGILSGFNVGDIVQIVENPYEPDDPHFRVQNSNGRTGYAAKLHGLALATPEEVAAAERKVAVGPFAGGGFAVISDTSKSHSLSGFNNGDYVKVGEATGGIRKLSVTKTSGLVGFCNADALRQITEAEYNEATAPKPAFSVGDKIRITRNQCNWPEGTVATVTNVESGGAWVTAFAKGKSYIAGVDAFTVLTAEEAAAIEKEAQETAKWAAVNRKVDEYKAGDIVVVVDRGSSAYALGLIDEIHVTCGDGTLVLKTGAGKTGMYIASSRVNLVSPVEQRFDKADAEKAAA